MPEDKEPTKEQNKELEEIAKVDAMFNEELNELCHKYGRRLDVRHQIVMVPHDFEAEKKETKEEPKK